MSKVLSRKAGCSEKWRKRVCAALGMTEQEVIQRSSEESAMFLSNRQPTTPPPVEPKEAADIKQEALSAVTALANLATITEDQLRFWRDLFEYLPSPICVMREGILVFHNAAHRTVCSGATVGRKICDTCSATKKKGDLQCPSECGVRLTQETGRPSTFLMQIENGYYCGDTRIIKINNTEYQTVIFQRIDQAKAGWVGYADFSSSPSSLKLSSEATS